MTDSEVESVILKLQYVSGNPPLTPMMDPGPVQFEARLFGILPDSASVGAPIDTLLFTTLDARDSLAQYTAWVKIWCDESNPNSSVLLLPDSFQIVDGIAEVEIENTEPETVWVYYFSEAQLIQKHDTFVKAIVFKEVGVEEQRIPTKFSLSVGAPNPFTERTVIRYALPVKSAVSLKIYDITGRLVCVIVDRKENPGYYTVKWDGSAHNDKPLASGIYFLKFKAGGYQATKKLILMR